ncbi:hypothetical protein AB0I51_43855 [Streptomyces sp. NPDC050549]|uniref:hypothetical protein n=1 Tax=Streptomyces sp. NPDC050549 TaxID=3155406 RepID=UPI003443F6DC
MSHPSSLPPPNFELASAFPEAAWLRQAAAVSDWAAIRKYVDGLPYGTDCSFAVRVLSEVDGIEEWLRPLVDAARDDVLALTELGAREVRIGWKIRTSAYAKDVKREQCAGLHAHLRQTEQLLIQATRRASQGIRRPQNICCALGESCDE